MIRLIFLGKLVDVAGSAEKLVEAETLEEVFSRLPSQLADALRCEKICVALNGRVISEDVPSLKNGDELAFLPPVSGG